MKTINASTAFAGALLCALALSPAAPAAAAPAAADARVDINSADAAELRTLPGIGRRRAERILAHRRQFGPFESVDALAEVSGIGAKLVERIRERLSADAPKRAARRRASGAGQR